jgi:hypothetical protein
VLVILPPIEVGVERDESGEITTARIRFGPHFLVQVRDEAGRVSFELVATHHGFRADASELDGELERLTEEIRRFHPDLAVD